MGFFADNRDEDLERAEQRELDKEFRCDTLPSRIYMHLSHILPKVLFWGAIALIVFIYGMMMFRIQTGKAPSALREFQWDAHAIATYQADPSHFSILSQEPAEDIYEQLITREEPLENGKTLSKKYSFVFQIGYVQYCPAANQFQVNVRYNDSIAKQLAAYYYRDALGEGEWFTFALQDQNGKLYTDYTYVAGERNVNNFRRLNFSGVQIEEGGSLTLLICDRENVNFEKPLFSLKTWSADLPIQTQKVVCPAAPHPLQTPERKG